MAHTAKHTSTLLFVSAGILALASACMAVLCYTTLEPVYRARPDPTGGDTAYEDGFPVVNWAEWRKLNSDVVGWITVPGTIIDYPVLRAHAGDPDFYLHHDIHRNWSIAGCIYLDANCTQGLLDSPNAILYGHNMHAAGMFTELVQMTKRSWGNKHHTVLLQTPGRKLAYTVAAADIVNAAAERTRTEFSSQDELRAWLDGLLRESTVAYADHIRSTRILSLVVCSYSTFGDERTVVYCTPRTGA